MWRQKKEKKIAFNDDLTLAFSQTKIRQSIVALPADAFDSIHVSDVSIRTLAVHIKNKTRIKKKKKKTSEAPRERDKTNGANERRNRRPVRVLNNNTNIYMDCNHPCNGKSYVTST